MRITLDVMGGLLFRLLRRDVVILADFITAALSDQVTTALICNYMSYYNDKVATVNIKIY